MIPLRLTEHPPGPTATQLRTAALRSAMILRDCSFRERTTALERRACRALMRLQSAQWRQPREVKW